MTKNLSKKLLNLLHSAVFTNNNFSHK